ncbi:hypothetical protein HDU76_000786 [Blyttiomyces sp. JEL0837]|nr:hypothetical protein HDU76_000786 [Blyttiomyces sp. JEL0837]
MLKVALAFIFAAVVHSAPAHVISRDSNGNVLHSRNCLADVIYASGAERKHFERRAGAGFAYEGELGPGNWGQIEKICQAGTMQSPINFVGTSLLLPPTMKPVVDTWPGPLPPVAFLNNGHTIQLNFQASGVVALTVQPNGITYNLVQQHFHNPSEHHVDGKFYPLEAHFVHSTADGMLTVIGVFFDFGAADPYIAQVVPSLPKGANNQTIAMNIDLTHIKTFIQNSRFFEYSGSLTTPPCTEGVLWLVAEKPLTVSWDQYMALQQTMEFNARFTQFNQDAVMRAQLAAANTCNTPGAAAPAAPVAFE